MQRGGSHGTDPDASVRQQPRFLAQRSAPQRAFGVEACLEATGRHRTGQADEERRRIERKAPSPALRPDCTGQGCDPVLVRPAVRLHNGLQSEARAPTVESHEFAQTGAPVETRPPGMGLQRRRCAHCWRLSSAGSQVQNDAPDQGTLCNGSQIGAGHRKRAVAADAKTSPAHR